MQPIKVNWEMKKPKQADISQMWNDIEYEIVQPNFEFIELLKENIGGCLYFRGFTFKDNEIFDWFCSRGRLDEINFTENFLLSKNVIQTFDEIGNSDNIRTSLIGVTPKLEWRNEFTVDGELAALLYHGGAYGSTFNKTAKEVKNKAQKFCDQIFGEKYQHEFVRFYYISEAWNSWFFDFIIDHTYLIISMETRTIWMLAFTDSD